MSHARLKEKHTFSDFIYWNIFLLVPFITAILAITEYSVWWTVLYVILALLMTAVIYRFFCTHCPHYLREEKSVKCMFFWGLPKFFEPRPGPYSFWEKTATVLATVIILAFPLIWLVLKPGLLVIYVLSLTAFTITIRRAECGGCIHHHCPVNKAGAERECI